MLPLAMAGVEFRASQGRDAARARFITRPLGLPGVFGCSPWNYDDDSTHAIDEPDRLTSALGHPGTVRPDVVALTTPSRSFGTPGEHVTFPEPFVPRIAARRRPVGRRLPRHQSEDRRNANRFVTRSPSMVAQRMWRCRLAGSSARRGRTRGHLDHGTRHRPGV